MTSPSGVLISPPTTTMLRSSSYAARPAIRVIGGGGGRPLGRSRLFELLSLPPTTATATATRTAAAAAAAAASGGRRPPPPIPPALDRTAAAQADIDDPERGGGRGGGGGGGEAEYNIVKSGSARGGRYSPTPSFAFTTWAGPTTPSRRGRSTRDSPPRTSDSPRRRLPRGTRTWWISSCASATPPWGKSWRRRTIGDEDEDDEDRRSWT